MTSRFSLVIGVLGALGVVVWSGCGSSESERYYCNSEACFQCDGYGCSRVTAPAHPTCTANTSCQTGSVCTATGCAAVCASDTACPKGETCQSGLCSPPGVQPGSPVDAGTPTGDGSPGPGPGPVTPNACKYSSECADNKVCADGQCLKSCETAACADGFTCDKSVCKPTPTDAGGPTACSTDATCGEGKYCNQGACVIDTRPKPNCTTDDQCGGSATPRKCLGGFCKYTCSDDQFCRTIDSRIGTCAKDNVCRSAAEASATCFAAGDCPTGQSCIANQCK